jgi:hypothetical protein
VPNLYFHADIPPTRALPVVSFPHAKIVPLFEEVRYLWNSSFDTPKRIIGVIERNGK